MKTHRIRLAGPWQTQQLDNKLQPVGDKVSCQLPYSILASQGLSGVLLLRGFHRPTGIEQNTVLRIILKANQQPHEVCINSNPADVSEVSRSGTANLNDNHGEYSIDITRSIAAFNQLSLSFRVSTTEVPATLETAWLEIQD